MTLTSKITITLMAGLFTYMVVANFYSGHWAFVADYYFGGN
jgi:hypothetical protein